jgi:hypothetical protein
MLGIPSLMAILIATVIIGIIGVIGALAYAFYKEIDGFIQMMVKLLVDNLANPLGELLIGIAWKIADTAEDIVSSLVPPLGGKMIGDVGDLLTTAMNTLDVTGPVSDMFKKLRTQVLDQMQTKFMDELVNMDLSSMISGIVGPLMYQLRDQFGAMNDLAKQIIVKTNLAGDIATSVMSNIVTNMYQTVQDQTLSLVMNNLVGSYSVINDHVKNVIKKAIDDNLDNIWKATPLYLVKLLEEKVIEMFQAVTDSMVVTTIFDALNPESVQNWSKSYLRNVMRPQSIVTSFVKGQSTSLMEDLQSELGSWNKLQRRVPANHGALQRVFWLFESNHNPGEWLDMKNIGMRMVTGMLNEMTPFTTQEGFSEALQHSGGAVKYLTDDKAWLNQYLIGTWERSGTELLEFHYGPAAFSHCPIAADLLWGSLLWKHEWSENKFIDIVEKLRFVEWGTRREIDSILRMAAWCHVASNSCDWSYNMHRKIIDRSMDIANYEWLTENMILKIGIGGTEGINSWGQTVGYGAHMVFNAMGDRISNLAKSVVPAFVDIQSMVNKMGGSIEEAWREMYTTFLPCKFGNSCIDSSDFLFVNDMIGGIDPFIEQKWLAIRMGTSYGSTIINNVVSSMKSFAESTWNAVSKGSGGCFIPGTKVILSDGSDCNIEDVSPGDRVLSFGGRCCKQSDEQVKQVLGDQLIYGFNEHTPFFTGGHCFQTTDGWKAICPELSKHENVTLDPGKLQVGDMVFKRDEYGKYETVEIKKITSESYPLETITYGLLLIGDNSYHANGFVVAMNYPVITAGYMRKGLSKLSTKERKRVMKHFGKIRPELNKSISDGFLERLR